MRMETLLLLFATSMLWKVVVTENSYPTSGVSSQSKKMPPQGWSPVLMRSLNEWLRKEEEERGGGDRV